MTKETLSPLYEADPKSIDELFSRLENNQIKIMPSEILDLDLSKRVLNLRDLRSKFVILQEELFQLKTKSKTKTSTSKIRTIEDIKNNPLKLF